MLRLHTEFQCPTMPGTGLKVCGGVGGGIMPDLITILMSTQRLSVLASMPVDMSKLHRRVGKSLAWTKGSLGLFPRIVSEETLRQLWDWLGARPNKGDGRRSEELGSGDGVELNNAAEATEEEEEAWVDALESLIDTLTTLACALAAVTTADSSLTRPMGQSRT